MFGYMASDPWHYPRPDLADRTFSVLEQRLANALTLFAPRRTGKTQFLLYDLGPLAEQRGHRVIYANFWQARLSPLATILHAIETSSSGVSLWDRARAIGSMIAPKLKLSGEIPSSGPQVTAEIDLGALSGEPPGELLLYLDDLLGRVASARKPTILMLDEIQELARDSNNDSLVAALRVSLDKRKDSLAAVFTGSSQDGLQQMFGAREAPFFHFATSIDLPPLDAHFVYHLLDAFKSATGRSLNLEAALKAFEDLHNNPYFFRRFLEPLLADPNLDISTAVDNLRARIAIDLGYPDTLLALTPIQRATAQVLAAGIEKPFSNVAREEIGRLLNSDSPTIARVQSAIRKLAALGVADRSSGTWTISDPEFATWIRDVSARDEEN